MNIDSPKALRAPGLLELWQPLRGLWFCVGALSGWATLAMATPFGWIALGLGVGGGLVMARTAASRGALVLGLLLQAGFGLAWHPAEDRAKAETDLAVVVDEVFPSGSGVGEVVESGDPSWKGARVRLRGGKPGDTLRGRARLRPPRAATVEGAFDERGWMASEGLDGRASWIGAFDARSPSGGASSRLSDNIRQFVRSALARRLEPSSAALWTATLLAENDRVPQEALDAFRRSGLFHMLSVSGFHMAVLGGGTLVLLCLVRVPRRIAWVLAALVVVGYTWLLGGSPPIARSAAAFALASLAWVSGRPVHAANGFFLALGVLVALDPHMPFQMGAQLTFAATAALLWVAPVLERWTIPVRWHEARAVRWVVQPLVLSVSATLATAPILAWNTGAVPWVGIPAGLAGGVVFSVGFLAAMATVALSFLPWWATSGFAGAADGSARLIWEITLRSGQWTPGTILVARPHPATLALCVVSVACIAWMARRSFRWKLVSALLCAWGVLGLAQSGSARRSLDLTFLDVGQGSATLVTWPSGRVWLVDAGPASWKDPRRNAGAERILPYMRLHGIRRLDAVVVTHADLDHWGGLRGLVEDLPPARLLLSVDSGTPGSPDFDSLVGDLAARGWSVERIGQGQELTYHDGARCQVLGPGLAAPLPRNRTSLVLRWVFDSSAAILSGDADSVEEAEIARSNLALRADVLLAGHHGSRHSSHLAWLESVSPRWTVLAYGPDNRYGHPNEEVLRRLEMAGSRVVHLPQGSATFRLDGHGASLVDDRRVGFWQGPWRREVSLLRPWTWKPPFAKSSSRPPSSDGPSTGS